MKIVKFFVLRCVNDIRLLVQYRQYSHRRLATLVGTISLLWLSYKIVHSVFNDVYLGGNPKVDHWCDREALPSYLTLKDPEEITLVITLFNLGSYRNGPRSWDYSNPYPRKQWMRPLGRVGNPVVAYIEDDNDAEYFREIRSCLPPERTKIIRVRRDELWSFQWQPYFKKIYAKKNYPQHYPNTVNSEYTSASHAKYELLEMAVKKNYFQTPFFAWLDTGYFRKLDGSHFNLFKIVPPVTYNEEMISMSQAYPHDPNIPAKDVIANNLVWVSVDMVLGLSGVLVNFTTVYKHTVEQLLRKGLSGSDEQIIYLMYSTPMRKPKQVKIKTYMCHEGQLGLYGRDVRFLCLGYVCKNSWDKIHKPGLN